MFSIISVELGRCIFLQIHVSCVLQNIKKSATILQVKNSVFQSPKDGGVCSLIFFFSNKKDYYTVLAFFTLLLFKLQRLSLEVLSVTSKHTKQTQRVASLQKNQCFFQASDPYIRGENGMLSVVSVCVCVCLTLHDKEYLKQRYFSFCHLDILSLLKNI